MSQIIMLISINFSFDFLRLDKVYFGNDFVNELTRQRLFKLLKILAVRALSDYKTLAFGSSFQV